MSEPDPGTIGFNSSEPEISTTGFDDGPEPIYHPATEFEPDTDTSLQIDSTELLG